MPEIREYDITTIKLLQETFGKLPKTQELMNEMSEHMYKGFKVIFPDGSERSISK